MRYSKDWVFAAVRGSKIETWFATDVLGQTRPGLNADQFKDK